jgi:hypothetical protein
MLELKSEARAVEANDLWHQDTSPTPEGKGWAQVALGEDEDLESVFRICLDKHLTFQAMSLWKLGFASIRDSCASSLWTKGACSKLPPCPSKDDIAQV